MADKLEFERRIYDSIEVGADLSGHFKETDRRSEHRPVVQRGRERPHCMHFVWRETFKAHDAADQCYVSKP